MLTQRRMRWWWLLLFIGFLLPTTTVRASTASKPVSYFLDEDQILTPTTEHLITSTNQQWQDSRNVPEVIVARTHRPAGDVDEMAAELFQKWGIGQASSDNGVLILANRTGKTRNIRIEVGYGLESTLTDSRAGQILARYRGELKSANAKQVDLGLRHVFQAVVKQVAPTADSHFFNAAVRTRSMTQQLVQGVSLWVKTHIFLIITVIVPLSSRFWFSKHAEQMAVLFDPDHASATERQAATSRIGRFFLHFRLERATRFKLAGLILAVFITVTTLFPASSRRDDVAVILIILGFLILPGGDSGTGSSGGSAGGDSGANCGGSASGGASGGGASGGGGASI